MLVLKKLFFCWNTNCNKFTTLILQISGDLACHQHVLTLKEQNALVVLVFASQIPATWNMLGNVWKVGGFNFYQSNKANDFDQDVLCEEFNVVFNISYTTSINMCCMLNNTFEVTLESERISLGRSRLRICLPRSNNNHFYHWSWFVLVNIEKYVRHEVLQMITTLDELVSICSQWYILCQETLS